MGNGSIIKSTYFQYKIYKRQRRMSYHLSLPFHYTILQVK
ncbi:hypothetical protein HMPREF0083_05605 [Aneurinibacillus aneurinilyticus ATCC 12856]|uniref:Uncharacterized protein n=1 Tax=Aneurinibacillus aneurinilyticus ATCC 12856 TaxID=649747 RepID=U1WSG7_ANEAE|nr:hypothetical protein HMPREF0083_05605 [Aneurinibacillus aneurinilyticus ATCC 12856]